MTNRISNLMYFLMAAFVSNVVYVIDTLYNSAIAADATLTCRTTITASGTIWGTGQSYCSSACTQYGGSNASGSWASYLGNSCICKWPFATDVPASVISQPCGKYWQCSGTVADPANAISWSCYTGDVGAAGWASLEGGLRRTFKGCVCCPAGPFGSGVTPTGYTIRSLPEAMAASDCYTVGRFVDATGLFEYTDTVETERCHYGE